MRILFATAAPITRGPSGPTSAWASARYRGLIPGRALARLGHEVRFVTVGAAGLAPEVTNAPCDVLVISKSGHESMEAVAATMRARGAKVVVDYCDDHFGHPQLGPHFLRLAQLADTLVASTEMMAQAVRRHTGRDARVIGDPVEGPRGVPRFAPGFPALKLAWFGHPSNLSGVVAKSGELHALARDFPVRLQIVTAPLPETANLAAALGEGTSGRVHAEVVPWSLEATWAALEQADLAWIPVGEVDHMSTKSPNRLVESLWAGRLVVADTVPSYSAFADEVELGKGLQATVASALEDRAGVEARIHAAQRRIARDHSAYACASAWEAALGAAQARPMKLNLGCGDKILPGYVNVDVVEARAGMKPDVICDLHDLTPFADASVDEILSVHVVEHFWRWEVGAILREWLRVLKPGGRLVAECPNLKSACETFLGDPQQRAGAGEEGQRTLWVFYGDPKWKDPLMVHRWGYTPESLKALLEEAGFVQVRQEPAQFKLREPRDMRVVGEKPARA